MASYRLLTSLDEWQAAQAASQQHPVLVFKHSTRCPVSAQAYKELQAYLPQAPAHLQTVVVHVIEARPVSNQVAEDTGIRHESPQALLLSRGQVVWHASHWEITAGALAKAIGHRA
ncbi:MAG: bacillithiol system redox-active protein YtxJ [Alicyclobacillus sp.]|nr:bacillithiol system redox-active protein YtxJ [Alicyclobacillus sp.]